MYVRFKVNSSSANGYGMEGMVETIAAVATASAGASITTPEGVSYFQVVSNTEAGGWTVKNRTTANYNYTDWRGYIEIESNTPKSGYKKAFKVFTNSSTSYPQYWGNMQTEFRAYDGANLRYNGRLAYGTGSSSSTNHTLWMPNLQINDSRFTWHFTCTANYAYLWYEIDGSLGTTYANNFAGVADLNNVPDSYLGSGNAFFPAIGFYSGSNNASYSFGTSTTSNYHDYIAHTIHGSYTNGDDGPFDYYNVNNVQYTGTGGVTTNDAPIQFGPYYYQNMSNAENVNYNYKPIFNASGAKVGSLTPMFYFNPYRGIPFTTLRGFYYYEPFERGTDSYVALPWNSRQSEILYDGNGDKYSLQYQPSNYGIRAFRAE